MKLFRYYTTNRPPYSGEVPDNYAARVQFWNRKFVPEINLDAFGFVDYVSPLDDQQIRRHELTPAEKNFLEKSEYSSE